MAESAGLELPFGTSEIVLRPILDSDAEAMLPYFASSEVCRFIPWEPRDLTGVQDFIADRCGVSLPEGDGDYFLLAIDAAGVGLVGQVNFTLKSREHSSAEIGYVINPAFHGQGFATAGTKLLMKLAFEVLGVRRLTAYIDERNLQSARVAQKLGMRLECRQVEVEKFKGEYVTMLTYAALARDWPGQTAG